MNSISISYNLIWQFKDFHFYKVSKCKKVFNTKSNRKLKHIIMDYTSLTSNMVSTCNALDQIEQLQQDLAEAQEYDDRENEQDILRKIQDEEEKVWSTCTYVQNVFNIPRCIFLKHCKGNI